MDQFIRVPPGTVPGIMTATLSRGAIASILMDAPRQNFVVQCTGASRSEARCCVPTRPAHGVHVWGQTPVAAIHAGVKKVQNANGQVRYRLMLSDGEFQYVCMLATQLSELPACGQLREGSIIEVSDYLCQFVQTKKYDACVPGHLVCSGV